jgi:type II secretory pathway pseudopilin PulG
MFFSRCLSSRVGGCHDRGAGALSPCPGRNRSQPVRSQSGFSLIEVLLASFIIITVGVGLLAGLTLTSRITLSTDNRETARDLAVAQMEYVKSLDFSRSYYDYDPELIPPGSGYIVSVVNPPQSLEDGNLQKITVVISRRGSEVCRLSDYKVNW